MSRKVISSLILFFGFCGFGVGTVLESIPSVRKPLQLHEAKLSSVSEEDLHTRAVKVLENRCAVCHSCFNAPCQLKLTSYEGFMRGGTKQLVYDPTRTEPVAPTRLYTDAQSTEEWRRKGFHSVANFASPGNEANLSNSIIWKMILQRSYVHSSVKIPAEESHTCPATIAEVKKFLADRPEAGMPYGLPALNEEELRILGHWLNMGAPGPKDETDVKTYLSGTQLNTVRDWEKFFNAGDLKSRVVARYIYEHLFLADIHFTDIPDHFFHLVRSKQACEKGVEEISTRRPYEDPGVEAFSYCFRRMPGTPVAKSHIVYHLSAQKMSRFRDLFFGNDWSPTHFPSWKEDVAANPFVAFQEIPGRARYQFLLDDAQYHVMTFIKGPVCKGNTAVDSIDEQFLVLFLDPGSDPYVNNPEFAQKTAELNRFPGQGGSDVFFNRHDIAELWNLKIITNRNRYRNYREQFVAQTKPDGYGLDDIWDGDGHNDNALLTVLRNYDSATVVKGAVGDVSKTAFVLDYVLFERLSYDLVAGFDVFGNIGHQLLTRLYMALIRMESEELFLSFLPPQERERLRNYWYRGPFTQAKLQLLYPQLGLDRPTRVKYQTPSRAKYEFFEQLFKQRLPARVRGPIDAINWKQAEAPMEPTPARVQEVEREFRRVTSRRSELGSPYVLQFPDVSFIHVRMGGDGSEDLAYTIIRNKEHMNIAWINLEEMRRDPVNDTIYITRGLVGSFPNRFFVVDREQVPQFVNDMAAIKDRSDAAKFVGKYGVRRANPDFWKHADWFNAKAKELYGVDAGLFDLNRYENPPSELN